MASQHLSRSSWWYFQPTVVPAAATTVAESRNAATKPATRADRCRTPTAFQSRRTRRKLTADPLIVERSHRIPVASLGNWAKGWSDEPFAGRDHLESDVLAG